MNGFPGMDTELENLRNHFDRNCNIKVLQSHSAKVHSVGWNCNGRKLASGSFDKNVVVHTLDREKLSKDILLEGHEGSVDQLSWNRNHPEYLATASGDRSARIWDARLLNSVAKISTPGENINITWSPDGSTIAVGNKEDLVLFIDSRTHKKIAEEQFQFEVNEITWNKKGDLFFVTNGQGCVVILSYPDLEQHHVIKAHPGTCICIDFDPNGQYFAVGSADALVTLWDIENLACVRTFSRLDWPVRTISFSHDGKLLASASEDSFIDIGMVSTGEKVRHVPVDAATFTVAWHPSQYLLAYACDDKDYERGKRDLGSLKVFGFNGDK